MTGDQWVSIITAFFGGVLALMAAFPAFYLAIRSANRPMVAAVEAIPVAMVEVQKPVVAAVEKAAEAVLKNTEVLEGPVVQKLDEVHLATNSTLERAKQAEEHTQQKLDEVIASRDANTLLTLESVRHQLDESKAEIATARAEIVRLNAAATPHEGAS